MEGEGLNCECELGEESRSLRCGSEDGENSRDEGSRKILSQYKILEGKTLANQRSIRQIRQSFTPPTFPTIRYVGGLEDIKRVKCGTFGVALQQKVIQ